MRAGFHARVRVDGTFVPLAPAISFWDTRDRGRLRKSGTDRRIANSALELATYAGLRDLSAKEGDCSYCCYAQDNLRIERWWEDGYSNGGGHAQSDCSD